MPPDFLLFTRLPLLCFRGGIGTPLHAIVCGLFSAAGFFTLFTCLPLLCFCGGIGMRIPLAGMMGVVSYLSHEFLNLPQSSWLGQALQLFVQAEIEKRIRGRAHILALKERSCNEFWLEGASNNILVKCLTLFWPFFNKFLLTQQFNDGKFAVFVKAWANWGYFLIFFLTWS
ncbi:uncharacterized protein LOC131070144 isoform X2 [Cryptomeria japonica]|uniref:uncharacterized protein LOC131070144 isoform X2 n=1 Tax=Cryptomeria japonica TaxID=3369 RepID=UPI0027D9EE77|nr:uncharacterized protein LOC131070144 isoform X2 [Cryptomeria japonica]